MAGAQLGAIETYCQVSVELLIADMVHVGSPKFNRHTAKIYQ